MNYYLAVDIGASSGRHILGWIEDGILRTEEIYRFQNGMIRKNGHRCWDYAQLFQHILNGMRACKELGKTPVSMGIDTWGVDFVLLDHAHQVLGDTVAYRDSRTEGMAEAVEVQISAAALYARTGTQKQRFNTIYQLKALQQTAPELLAQAETMLLVPAYFSFLLTGIVQNEYTEASTTGLLDAAARDWDMALITSLGFPQKLFGSLAMPGSLLGSLKADIAETVGFTCNVRCPGSHDTASAVLAVPAEEKDFCYISSGTWSLMGVECPEPIRTEIARQYNLTNEGGFGGSIRLLKNIMGTWMIQSVKKELKNEYSFDDLCNLAEESKGFSSKIDVNDDCFLAPESMIEAIQTYCAGHGQPVPETTGQIMRCIYRGLSDCYAETFAALEDLTNTHYEKLYIVGGGSKDWYLNRLTSEAIGRPVSAGPTEATAIGNLLAQLLGDETFTTVGQAREAVRRSFPVTISE